jgi:hypothetical protein
MPDTYTELVAVEDLRQDDIIISDGRWPAGAVVDRIVVMVKWVEIHDNHGNRIGLIERGTTLDVMRRCGTCAKSATTVRCSDVTVQLTGLNGNAFSIMGAVRKALRNAGYSATVITAYTDEAMAGDYDNLLTVSSAWVHVK